MKRPLLFIPLFFALLACDFSATIFQNPEITPTMLLPQPIFTLTSPPLTGTITGTLSYPSDFLPAMRVVAFSLTDGNAYFVDVVGQSTFSMNVPAGTYYVVSYLHEGVAGNTGQADAYTPSGGTDYGGGYSQMVPCGLSVGCDDHTLLQVSVAAGQSVEVSPGDWYAPPGTFPPMPNP